MHSRHLANVRAWLSCRVSSEDVTDQSHQLLTLAQWVNSSLRVSLLLRGTLISSIFRQAAAFDHRERNKWTVGKLMTLMTSDVNRIDYAANQAPSLWAAPLRVRLAPLR